MCTYSGIKSGNIWGLKNVAGIKIGQHLDKQSIKNRKNFANSVDNCVFRLNIMMLYQESYCDKEGVVSTSTEKLYCNSDNPV